MDRKNKGLTMVELMVTLAIIAVVLAIAIPAYNTQVPRFRLNGAARKVMGDLMGARMNAVKLNTTVTVNFDGALNTYTVSYVNEDGDTVSETFNIQTHFPGVSIDADASVIFSSSGIRGTGSSASVTIENDADDKTININVAGIVKISD
jgi:type IV fimbrial biogenesis protein FimT